MYYAGNPVYSKIKDLHLFCCGCFTFTPGKQINGRLCKIKLSYCQYIH